MPKRKIPILRRARALITCSITPLNRNLLLFRKANKRFPLLQHYNYGYFGEYEFSPPDTPLLQYPWQRAMKKRKRFLSLFLCGGGNAAESSVAGGWGEELEVVSTVRDHLESAVEWEEEEDVSIDGRAEKFIQKFYEEMRIQRRRSM